MNQPIIETATVRLDADLGGTKEEVIRALAATLVEAGRADDPDTLVSDLLAREAKAATGMKGGIAIPHCKSAAVRTPSLGFARLDPPVDFGAKDGPADLVLMIGAPAGGGKEHLKLLATLARNLVRRDFVDALRAAATTEDAVAVIQGVLNPDEGASSSSSSPGSSPGSSAAGSSTAGSAAAGAAGNARRASSQRATMSSSSFSVTVSGGASTTAEEYARTSRPRSAASSAASWATASYGSSRSPGCSTYAASSPSWRISRTAGWSA